MVQLWDKREIFPSPYYSTLYYNNKSGFSLLIKALELPVPLSDPFAETFNTHYNFFFFQNTDLPKSLKNKKL